MTLQLPDYDDLPRNEKLGMNYSWDVWGEDDDLGTINLLTAERVNAASAEIRNGRIFNLSMPLNAPCSRNRLPYRHTIFWLDRNTQDDVVDNLFLQATTQWDGLRHIAAREFGFYNGVPKEEAGPEEPGSAYSRGPSTASSAAGCSSTWPGFHPEGRDV